MFTLEQLYLLRAGLNVMLPALHYSETHQCVIDSYTAIRMEHLFNDTFRELNRLIDEVNV